MRGLLHIALILFFIILLLGSCASPPPVKIPYTYHKTIYTYDSNMFLCRLTAGEEFEGEFTIWRASQRTPTQYAGTIIFYIVDVYGQTVLDAGNITTGYKFKIVADSTMDYIFCFDDLRQECTIEIAYNSPERLSDITR